MGHTLGPGGQVPPNKEGVTHVQFNTTSPALLDHERQSPRVKLVALQKGTNQKDFTCAVLNRTDLGDGEDWMRNEKVQGGMVGIERHGREEEGHTVQELKQINNQLYKFVMKNLAEMQKCLIV